MSEFLKTITANFETVDLAEWAARNIKEHFIQVKSITIRYRNVPDVHDVQDSDVDQSETTALLAATAMGSGMGTAFAGGYPGFLPIGGKTFMQVADTAGNHPNRPEIERSTESKLLIKASESQAKQIEAHLRSLGGLHIMTK